MQSNAMVVGSFSPSVVLGIAMRLELVPFPVTEVLVRSSPEQFRSLLSGEIDAALTSPDNVLAYRFDPGNPLGELADIRMVSAVDRGLGLGLFGRVAEGCRLGVDVPGSGFAFAAYRLIESLGISSYQEVVLGSTPRRLEALLAGDCDVTMLNAGNDLRAEDAGMDCLARVSEVASPYLGTVLAALPGVPRVDALAAALADVAQRIVAGDLDALVTEVAGPRYLARLKDPREGLIPGGVVDPASMKTVIDLRKRYRGGDYPWAADRTEGRR